MFTEPLLSNDVAGGIHIRTHKQQGDLKSVLIFFPSWESRLKTDLKKTGQGVRTGLIWLIMCPFHALHRVRK
jgi:hypothetical protein